MRGGSFDQPKELWFLVFDQDGIVVDQVDGNLLTSDHRNRNPIVVFNHQMVLVGNVDSPEMLVWKSLVTNKVIRVTTSIDPDFFHTLHKVAFIQEQIKLFSKSEGQTPQEHTAFGWWQNQTNIICYLL
jgi:hypothetical protein